MDSLVIKKQYTDSPPARSLRFTPNHSSSSSGFGYIHLCRGSGAARFRQTRLPQCICKGEPTDTHKLCKIITNMPHLAQNQTPVAADLGCERVLNIRNITRFRLTA